MRQPTRAPEKVNLKSFLIKFNNLVREKLQKELERKELEKKAKLFLNVPLVIAY